MTTNHKGSQRRTPRRASTPIPASSPAMTAAEAAPAIEAAHDAASMAAAPLVPAEALAPAPIDPATPSPNTMADTPATPADQHEDSIMDVNATIENATADFGQKGGAMFADVSERAKGAVEKSQKLLAEVAEFNKGTLEAMVESSKIAARGLETMGQDAAAYAKTSFEGATQMMKTLATVKSPTEFMRIQADYTRTAFDALVAHTSRSTEASLKLAGEVAQPISNRVALAVDKIKVAA